MEPPPLVRVEDPDSEDERLEKALLEQELDRHMDDEHMARMKQQEEYVFDPQVLVDGSDQLLFGSASDQLLLEARDAEDMSDTDSGSFELDSWVGNTEVGSYAESENAGPSCESQAQEATVGVAYLQSEEHRVEAPRVRLRTHERLLTELGAAGPKALAAFRDALAEGSQSLRSVKLCFVGHLHGGPRGGARGGTLLRSSRPSKSSRAPKTKTLRAPGLSERRVPLRGPGCSKRYPPSCSPGSPFGSL